MKPRFGSELLFVLGMVEGAAAMAPAQCTPGSCDDNNPCTVDTCDPVQGCIYTPTNCDDGNVCTIDSCLPTGGPGVATLLIGHDTAVIEQEYQKNGTFVQNWGTSTHVTGAAVDANGIVYVCNPNYVFNGGNVIERRGPGNTPLGTIAPVVNGEWIEDLGNYTAGFILASTDLGNIFAIDTTTGADTFLFATGHSIPGVTFDGVDIWTTGGTTPNNTSVYRRNLAGTVLSSFNTNQMNGGIGYDPDDGTLWIGHPNGQVTHHTQSGTLIGGFATAGNGGYLDGVELGNLILPAGCAHTPVDCSDNDICTDDACNPMTGCSNPPRTCNDNNPCTDDACSSLTGCVYSNNTAPCDDSNFCTAGDTCMGGLCGGSQPVICNDNNVCTNDSCDPRFGCQYVNNNGFCDDGDACTIEDVCSGGTCQPGIPVVCNDFNACTTDTCIPPQGCVYVPDTGSPCDDGNACTTGEVCVNGTCQLGVGVACTPSDQCHVAGVCDPVTGICSNPAAPNGTACNDGNPCTAGDICVNGVCAGTPVGYPVQTQNMAAAADKVTFSWSPVPDATGYDAVRGATLPVGSSSTESCFHDLTEAKVVDATPPATGTGFWYLSRPKNPCGYGPWGQQSNGTARVTTTCP